MSDHMILLAVQRQVAGLTAERDALRAANAAMQSQIEALVAERDALLAYYGAPSEVVRVPIVGTLDATTRLEAIA